jgi:hypothetical protein
MTDEEIVAVADCILRAQAGEVDKATLDAETERVTRAEDHVALNLACKILSGRPYVVCTDVPVIWMRASSMAEYLRASCKQMQIDIGDGEFLAADVYRPAAPREADKPYKRILYPVKVWPPWRAPNFFAGG